MKRKSYLYSLAVVGISLITVVSITSAFTGIADIVIEGDFVANEQSLGSGGIVVDTSAGASTALDDLASVAINESLISDTHNTDDLGAFGLAWNDVFASGTAYSDTLTVSGVTTPTSTILGSTYFGSGSPANALGALTADGSLYVTGGMEVDGRVEFDSVPRFWANANYMNDSVMYFGSGNDGQLSWDSTQTPDALVLGINEASAQGSNALIVTLMPATTNLLHEFRHDPYIAMHSSSTTNIAEFAAFNYDSLALTGFESTATSTFSATTGSLELQSFSATEATSSFYYASSTKGNNTIFTQFANNMCIGQLNSTTTPNLTLAACEDF